VITPNEDSVKEVKVVANNYDAENGRYAGGQVQVTSANGTNEFHGSPFIKIDRPGLNAYNSWGGPFGGQPQRNNSRFNHIDGSITTDLLSRGAIPRTSRLERHRRDLVAFSIYEVPVSSSFYNGPSLPMNFYHHDAINEAMTGLWRTPFLRHS
jgi:hypothetical protein